MSRLHVNKTVIGFIFLWRETQVVTRQAITDGFGSLKLSLFICLRVLFSFPLHPLPRSQARRREESFERVVGSIVILAS